MKKRTLVLGLAALCLSFGSMTILGGVSSNIGNNAIVTKAEDAETTTQVAFGEGNFTITGLLSGSYTDGLGTAWNISVTGDKITGTNVKNATKKIGETSTKGLSIGTNDNPATSIVLEGAIPSGRLATSASIYLIGNAAKSAGTVTIKVGDAETTGASYTGSTNPATISSDSGLSGQKISIKISGITGGVTILGVTYTTKEDTTPTVSVDGDADVLASVGQDKELSLKTTYFPENGQISATTGDALIATASIVDSTLKITAVAAGTTTYTVSVKDSAGNSVASCTGNITISSAITAITVSSNDFNADDSLKLGKSYQLIAAASPSGASNEVTWSSDNDAAIVSESGLLQIVSNSSDTITVTATSTVDTSVSGTITFSIDSDSYNLSIFDLISNDGKTFANSIKDGTTVMTKGTITAIDGTSAYIQSGSSAIYVYTSSDAFSGFKVGDGVKVSGAVKVYNGQAEIVPASVEADDTAKEEISSLELDKANLISANTSRLAKATKAVCLESKAISTATGATSVKFKFADTVSDSSEFVAYFKKSDLATMYAMYGDFDKDAVYNLSGIFINSVTKSSTTPRLVLGASFGSYTNQNLLDFITDYIDGQDSHGSTCAAKYAAASAALANLGTNTQAAFKTATAYNSAYEIYRYWELNQTSVSTAKLVTNSNTSDWGNAALIAGAFTLVGGATFFFIHNNRKKQDR